MPQAFLTIDDVPSGNLNGMIPYFKANGIQAVLFASHCFVGDCRDALLSAIGDGFIIGNHSWSHPHFSALSEGECVREIERMEEYLDGLYQEAGVARKYRLFRFPYFDKGGTCRSALQRYLRERGFVKLDDRALTSKAYRADGWNLELDTSCSYDCAEYLLPESLSMSRRFHAERKALNLEDALRKMDLPDAQTGDTLLREGDRNILLLHAHDATEALFPRYWETMLSYLLRHGMAFLKPAFIDADGKTVA